MSLGNLLRLTRNRIHGVKPLVVPSHLSENHAPLRDRQLLEASLKRNYSTDPAWIATPEGAYDFQDHISGRQKRAREEIVPWVSNHATLAGKTVLEIGCGTGSSTVAFVEQKAIVTAYDIDKGSVAVAQDRLAAHGLEADVRVQEAQPSGSFDIILMYAVLEHMTLEERLSAIREAWGKLNRGGILVVVETPNRLWYYDVHTSKANFFMWLPDDLALLYAKRTPRDKYNDIRTPIELARWGRGVSFHDFEVALDMPCAALPVISSMTHWIRRQTNTHRIGKTELGKRWELMLQEIHKDAHEGFTTEFLDVILQKN